MMPTQSTITIQSATPADDALIAAHFIKCGGTTIPVEEIAYLRSMGCTHAVLNASPSGRPVYSSLGFADN